MKEKMLYKTLVVCVIVLFIGMGVQPALATVQYSVVFNDVIEQNINKNDKGEFISLYYANFLYHFEKHGINGRGAGGTILPLPYDDLYFNADLDELKIELILNYTVEMNYTLKMPFNFAPISVFGISIENITDCEWEYFKLKHHGYFKRTGNFSIVFDVDMSSVESGDLVIIQPILYSILIQDMELVLNPYTTNKALISFIRLIYHIPILNELILTKWIFPMLGNNENHSVKSSRLNLYFE
jgi:hypothetical protein